MRSHSLIRHRAPRMIRRCGLGIPHVAGVSGELTALQRPHHRLAVADERPRRVDQICATFHGRDQLVVEQPTSLSMQWRVDRDHVEVGHHLLHRGVVGGVQLLLDLGRQPVLVGVVQMNIERRQPPQHGQADPAGGDGAHLHSLEVVGALHAIGDIPAAPGDPLMRRAGSCGPGTESSSPRARRR